MSVLTLDTKQSSRSHKSKHFSALSRMMLLRGQHSAQDIKHDRLSVSSLKFAPSSKFGISRQKMKHENSYRMDPKKPFQSDRVKRIIGAALREYLENKDFDDKCIALTKIIATEITSRVKRFNYHRYRIISVVSIGQDKRQGLHIASSFVWDPKVDNFASATFSNKKLFAVGVVYGVYLE